MKYIGVDVGEKTSIGYTLWRTDDRDMARARIRILLPTGWCGR